MIKIIFTILLIAILIILVKRVADEEKAQYKKRESQKIHDKLIDDFRRKLRDE